MGGGGGGRLFELGANSRLGAYSNKYGSNLSVTVWKSVLGAKSCGEPI